MLTFFRVTKLNKSVVLWPTLCRFSSWSGIGQPAKTQVLGHRLNSYLLRLKNCFNYYGKMFAAFLVETLTRLYARSFSTLLLFLMWKVATLRNKDEVQILQKKSVRAIEIVLPHDHATRYFAENNALTLEQLFSLSLFTKGYHRLYSTKHLFTMYPKYRTTLFVRVPSSLVSRLKNGCSLVPWIPTN